MKDLMRPEIEDRWNIKQLQNCILNIAEYMDEFCQQNDIDYCLMGGSALGAVRHQGFIPWDDDLDVFMTPDNYEKFRKCFSEKGDKVNYYLQEWGACDGMVIISKLRLNPSMYIEEDLKDWKINHGVYVDIFILHTAPENKIKRMHQFLWARYLIAKGAANRHYQRKSGIVGLGIKMLGVFPDRFLLRHALKQVYKYRNDKSIYQCNFLGRAGFKKGLYKSEHFKSTKRVPFETISLNVNIEVEEFLKERWGDYMRIPPIEEIRHCQHSWKWSDSEPFPGYNPENYYPDEPKLLA